MKTRRHHNNKGSRQIKKGKTVEQVKRIAKKLGIPYGRRASSALGEGEKIGQD